MATRPMTLVQSRRVGFARQLRSLVQAGAIAALCLLGAAGCMTPQPPLAQDGAAGADERAPSGPARTNDRASSPGADRQMRRMRRKRRGTMVRMRR